MISQLYRFISPRYQKLFLEYKVNFRPRYGHGNTPHQRLFEIINLERKAYALLLEDALKFREVFCNIKKVPQENNPDEPVYNNGYLPGLDIVMLYTLVAKFKPKNYLEIGSGYSTKVAYKAIRENKLDTQITSIDPAPRAEIDKLVNTMIRESFEDTDLEALYALKENDILFVDNSHRILPNSDAMVFFMEVLPRLQKGVIVHIHDIYLPYDYPQFMCDRFYSEQYGLAIYLMANNKRYKPLLPNYFISQDIELRTILQNIWNHPNLNGVEQHGGSFWLRIQ